MAEYSHNIRWYRKCVNKIKAFMLGLEWIVVIYNINKLLLLVEAYFIAVLQPIKMGLYAI